MDVSSDFIVTRAVSRVSLEAAAPLQNLDLVAVRILDEEKSGEQAAVPVEFDDLARLEPRGLKARVLAVEIIDADGHMAVAVPQLVGGGAALVDRQLDLEGGLLVREVDEREVRKVEPFGDLQAECLVIE